MSDYLDGDWHRLHPATPFLRGGLALVAIVGIVAVNLRDVLINLVFGGGHRDQDDGGDPLLFIAANGLVGVVLLAILVGIAVLVAFFYVSWRMHTFRITHEAVEVRSGILFRTNRKARLDRIQGIGIQRPFLARIFGAARLEISVAGQDGNVRLDYLRGSTADELRIEVLRLAAGGRDRATAAPAEPANEAVGLGQPDPAIRGIIEQRVSELLAPELAPGTAAPESVVTMHLGRLLGSIVLSGAMFWVLVFIIGPALLFQHTGDAASLVVVVPGLIGVGGFVIRRFTKSLQYTIAPTADGIRVGFGLLSTTNDTIPPGRIHAIEVRQPLLWRPAGWWEIRMNRASTSHGRGASQENTTILPVGNLADALRVLSLVVPEFADQELLERGIRGTGTDRALPIDFTISPPRARILRPLSRRRNGFARVGGFVLLRRGVLRRELVIVPLPRAQGIALHQGPLERRLRLAELRIHTVQGPVVPRIGAIDATLAMEFFTETADAVVTAATADTSHRWRASSEVTP